MKTLLFAAFSFFALVTRAETPPVWIASLLNATSIEDDGMIAPPDLGSVERPTFLRIDPAAKTVTLLAPASRRGEVSAIDSIQRGEEGWILQGLENGRVWTILISDNGHLSMSAVTDGEIWAVFGNVLPLGDVAIPPK